jgi:hypothetical protein
MAWAIMPLSFGHLRIDQLQPLQLEREHFSLRQTAKPACAQQIADHNGQLDPHLFQQTLHLVLQSHPLARELQLHPRQVAPNTLLPTRDKA